MPFSARRCCIAVAVSLALAALPALAQEQATQYELNLPEQPLADSLRGLGKTAHVNIVFDPAAVAGRRAPMLNGRYATDEALVRLLAGSGLNVRETAGGSYTVEAPHARNAAPADAGASASTGEQAQNRDGIYTFDPLIVRGKVEGFSATRMPTDLKDIPQSVSVIDQQTLREQNAYSLSKAFNWAPGITLEQGDSTQTFFQSRGFSITTIHIDGGAPLIGANNPGLLQRIDLSQYDSVELLRGADALFGGSGNPGGSIHLARKRPLPDRNVSITASAGSWDTYRVEADINTGKITDDGRLRGRLVAVNESEHYFYDTAERRMSKLYAVTEYDLLPRTRVTLGGVIERTPDFVQFRGGLPRYADGSDPHLPRSTALAFPWNKNSSTSKEGFFQLEHAFNERWKLKAGITRQTQEQSGLGINFMSAINPVTRTIAPPLITSSSVRLSQTAYDLTLTGGFDWNGRAQEVVLGFDAVRQEMNTPAPTFYMLSGPPIDPFHFDPANYGSPTPMPTQFSGFFVRREREHGVFASIKLRPADAWTITAGARNNFRGSNTEAGFRLGSGPLMLDSSRNSHSGVITPFLGVVYAISPQYNLYASYADASNGAARAVVTASGKTLDPPRGTNMELGLKGAWRGGRINGSLALFDIKQIDVPDIDPLAPGSQLPSSNCCYISTTQLSKGFEAELNRQLTPGWQVGSGYTFNINRAGDGSTLSSVTPKHLLKLWTNYRLPGPAQGWEIGGGITAQSKNYREGIACTAFNPSTGACTGQPVPFRAEQGFYTVATLRAGYRLNESWNLALNVDNLFDRRYYQTIGDTRVRNWYGAPRNWMLTLRGGF